MTKNLRVGAAFEKVSGGDVQAVNDGDFVKVDDVYYQSSELGNFNVGYDIGFESASFDVQYVFSPVDDLSLGFGVTAAQIERDVLVSLPDRVVESHDAEFTVGILASAEYQISPSFLLELTSRAYSEECNLPAFSQVELALRYAISDSVYTKLGNKTSSFDRKGELNCFSVTSFFGNTTESCSDSGFEASLSGLSLGLGFDF